MLILQALSVLVGAAVSARAAANGGLQTLTNFGTNPTKVLMYYYKPKKLASPLPVIVVPHFCQGSAQAMFTISKFADLADTYGYVVLYPEAPDPGKCWDVHTDATLTHNAGGDSLGIVSGVRYVISNWGVDATRVFVTGGSSGAMMTSVLIGAYPDVFKAGSGFSGVPYGCFKGSGLWSVDCAHGEVNKTPQQWGDMVRAGYPGFTGDRPKMQIWHGTADNVLYVQNFFEGIKQWTNVFDYSQTPITNVTNSPEKGYSWATYGPKFEAILAQNVGHTVPDHEELVLKFFGIIGSSGAITAPNNPTTVPSNPTTSAPLPSSTGTVAKYGQCGGSGYIGPTVCVSGCTCTKQNDFYSQCL